VRSRDSTLAPSVASLLSKERRSDLDARSAPAALIDALASLSQDDRDVVVLVAWEELSYEEAATALAIPIGTVRSRLDRARRVLRELLGDIGNERATITCEPQGDAR
jgi:RNA polymerase sigma factor (sigma-70 family)